MGFSSLLFFWSFSLKYLDFALFPIFLSCCFLKCLIYRFSTFFCNLLFTKAISCFIWNSQSLFSFYFTCCLLILIGQFSFVFKFLFWIFSVSKFISRYLLKHIVTIFIRSIWSTSYHLRIFYANLCSLFIWEEGEGQST